LQISVEEKGSYVVEVAKAVVLTEVITGGRYIVYDEVPLELARTFLLTYRLYSSPSSLAKQLVKRYESTRNPSTFYGI
jgi:hypothetical protein